MSGFMKNCTSITSFNMPGIYGNKLTDCSEMLSGCKSLTKAYLQNFTNGSDGTTYINYSDIFKYDTKLKTVIIGKDPSVATTNYINLSNADNTSGMFFACEYLESVDITENSLGKVKDMSNMFSLCNRIKYINLNLTNVETECVTIQGMFRLCSSVERINLGNIDLSKVADFSYAF